MINRKQEADKDKLQQLLIKSMKTIMIGAVATVEEKLGLLWAHGQNRQLTEQEQELQNVFMDLRKEILDKGNTQIRNCKQLMDGYTIEFNGFSITLPVVRRPLS